MIGKLIFSSFCLALTVAIFLPEHPLEFHLARPLSIPESIANPQVAAVGQCVRDDQQLKLAQVGLDDYPPLKQWSSQ